MIRTRLPFRARASLIDRLVDVNPRVSREARPLRTLNRDELKTAIARDLTWLFNTRSPHPHRHYDQRELTVIDYGIPDFGAMWTDSPDDRTLLVQRLERAVAAFEPRLDQVRVEVVTDRINEKRLRVQIAAVMPWEGLREPVSFETMFHHDGRASEVHAYR